LAGSEDAEAEQRSASGKAANNASRTTLRTIRRMKMRTPDSPEVERPLSESVERARALVDNGDRLIAIEAIALLKTRLAEHPDDVDAHYWMGRARVVAEEPRQSAESFEAAIKLDPEFVAPHRWAAYAYHQRRLFSDAVVHLNKAVQLAPKDPDVYIDRVVCAVADQQWELVLTDVKMLCDLGETQFCNGEDAVRTVVERRSARKAGQLQGKRAAKAGSKRVEALRPPGELGSLRDRARAKAKGKMGKMGKMGMMGKMGKRGNRAEDKDNDEDGSTTE